MLEAQLEAFRDELRKEASKWYTGAANFAKRQVHSLSGWAPKEGIEAIGGGAAPARAALEHAMKSGKNIAGAKASLAANEKAQQLGLTSLPGYAKALWNPATRKEVLPAAIAQQFKGTPKWEQALTVGIPAAGLVGEALSKDDPEHPTKGKRMGAAIASTAAGMATGSLPLAGSALVGAGAGALGGAVGSGVDRLRALRRRMSDGPHPVPNLPNPEEARGNGPPVERNMSPSAAGQAPDWSGNS